MNFQRLSNQTISITLLLAAGLLFSCTGKTSNRASSELELWNEGETKSLLVSFVKRVCDKNDSEFQPPSNRIAVLDVDGTLLVEKPFYTLVEFAAAELREKIKNDPGLMQRPSIKACVEGNWDYFSQVPKLDPEGVYAPLLEAHAGFTEQNYSNGARRFVHEVQHPRFHVPYERLEYTPMLQLIRYLQEHSFTVYLCSGSDIDFLRSFSESAFGVPSVNVIGTQVVTKWSERTDGSDFVRQREFVNPVNDEDGKPVNIQRFIGKRPILAIGNSAGDYGMLELSDDKNPSTPDLQLIVNHDDADREYEYAVDKMREMALKNGWHVISMKRDWARIFQFQ